MEIDFLQACVREIEITPNVPVILGAELNPRLSEGVHSPLMARCLALSSGVTRLALVTLDLIGLDQIYADHLVRTICKDTGLKPESVMLVCSHTRNGPVTAPLVGCTEIQQDYLGQITPKICRLISQSFQNLQPASLGYGQVSLPNLVWNHRLVTRNLKTISARLRVPENEVLYPEGQIDPDLKTLVVRDQEGFPICLVWNFTADPGSSLENKAEPGSQVDAGLPFLVQKEIDRRIHRHVPALYIGGCAGDVSFQHEIQTSANWLASGVMAAYLETSTDPEVHLEARMETVVLPIQDVDQFWNKHDIECKYPEAVEIYRSEIETLRKENLPAWRSSLRVFQIGRIALVGLPGMPFVEASRKIQEKSPFPHTMVCANAHSHIGYLPPERSFDLGGFETWVSRSCRIGRGAGEFLSDQALRLLQDTQMVKFGQVDRFP